MKRFLEEAKKMIRIDSVSANGNEELANYVAGLLQDKGFKVQLQQVTHSLEGFSKRQFNVIGIMGDPLVDRKIRKGLLLNTHLDTVSPGLLANWTENGGDPFTAVIRDGRIFGLGTVDVKLDFLCKLHAAAKVRERKLRQPLYLVGTCGEETGMFGARYLIKALTLNPKYVLVGEPSELKLVHAHKCLNVFKVSVGYQQVERDARGFNRFISFHSFGRSAHASYPDRGVNAIKLMFDFLQRAADSGFELRFTEFNGGDTTNRVPDTANCRFYLTSHQLEDFKRFFREMVKVEGYEKAFRMDLEGMHESGVKFLPDTLFPCLSEVVGLYEKIASDFLKVCDESYLPAHSTVSFGKMTTAMGKVEMGFDLRLLPDLSPEELQRHVQDGITKIARGYPGLNINVARERMNPGLNVPANHEFVALCQQAMTETGLSPAIAKKATSTEAAQYQQAGYPALVFGPGVSVGNSHSPNEYNLLDHLEKATAFYERVIEKACL